MSINLILPCANLSGLSPYIVYMTLNGTPQVGGGIDLFRLVDSCIGY